MVLLMILVWVVALVAGLSLTLISSHRTLDAARSLAEKLGLSPFIVGMTVVAVGTDLPEIANSLTASATGHGDINVGDSIGSVVTQITLVLGILLIYRQMRVDRRPTAVAGLITVIALVVGAIFVADEYLSRGDGLVLIALWVVGTLAIHHTGHMPRVRQEVLFTRGTLATLSALMVGLLGVAFGAIIAVKGFTEVALALEVPEYVTSFLVLSLGTSLPELAVDWQALKAGEGSLALGDIVGSSFVDSTLSLGIGPAVFPVAVSGAAQYGSLMAAVIVAIAIGLLLTARRHGRRTGMILIGLYAVVYLVMLT